jgi:hypothetical protein
MSLTVPSGSGPGSASDAFIIPINPNIKKARTLQGRSIFTYHLHYHQDNEKELETYSKTKQF